MTLPIAIVGAGLIGQRHIEVARKSARVDLVAVVETDADRRAALNAQGVQTVAQIADLPRDTRAVVIATPTPAHGAGARAALDRGCAVLVEKPIAGTVAEGRGLIAMAEAKGLPLITGHHRRCHPFVAQACARISDLGPIVAVQGFWSLRKPDTYFEVPWRRAPGAGPLMTNLSHELDLLRVLIGEITEVTATTSHARRDLAVEDTAALTLRFASGALGSFVISDAGLSPWAFEAATGENPMIPRSGQDYLRVTCEGGALAFPSGTTWRGTTRDPDWTSTLIETAGVHTQPIDPIAVQLDRFADHVDGAQDDLLATGKDGLAALEWTLATALSAHQGRPMRAEDVPDTYQGPTQEGKAA